MKKINYSIAILLFSVSSFAQDLHFSNLKLNNYYNSIASIGGEDAKYRGGLHYRNQSPTVASAYQTMGLFTDYSFKMDDNSLGIGLMVNRDVAGDLSLTRLRAEVAIAYHQKITNYSHLGAGIQFGITQHSIDESNAQWQNQYDGKGFNPNLSSNEQPLFQPFINFGVGAGLNWKYDKSKYNRFDNTLTKLEIGASLYHLASPGLTYYSGNSEYSRISISGNAEITLINGATALEPAFLYSRKGKESEFVFGTLYKFVIREESKYTGYYDRFDMSFGAYVRLPGDAIIPTFNLNYDNYQLGVSYDATISDLAQANSTLGGLEVTLRFLLR